jgi:hypothetical protein
VCTYAAEYCDPSHPNGSGKLQGKGKGTAEAGVPHLLQLPLCGQVHTTLGEPAAEITHLRCTTAGRGRLATLPSPARLVGIHVQTGSVL